MTTTTTTTTMQALRWTGETLEYSADNTVPSPKPGEARIRVLEAGVCNTDLEIVKGYMGFTGILGHEFVGVVDAAPDSPEWIGKRVCVDINAAPQDATDPHHNPDRTVIGIVNHDGAFAEYLVAPVWNLYPVPDRVENDEAVFVEPLAAAFEIPEQVKIQKSQRVMVLGDGKLGLLIAMVLRLSSDHVTLLGRHAEKMVLVEDLGIQTALSADNMTTTTTNCADVVVEATGSASGLQQAMALCQPRGTIVLKSTIADTASLNLAPIVVDEITVVGSRCGPFDKALQALERGDIPVKRLIQKRFALKDGVDAMNTAATKGMLKVLLDISSLEE